MPSSTVITSVAVVAVVALASGCAIPSAEADDGPSAAARAPAPALGCDDDGCALGVAPAGVAAATEARAVTGAPLAVCGLAPLTGFLRDGTCRTGVDDVGAHTVCGEVSAAFLSFSQGRGNDLVTPRGAFPGLVPGDRWCLCESRVREASDAGVQVPVVLEATNAAALRTLSLPALEALGRLARPRAN